MPTNMPTAANENEKEMAAYNTSQTEIHEQNVPQNANSHIYNQELANSGQMAISQHLISCAGKRIRGGDEEADELASPTKYSRMCTSAMPGVENWEAFTLCQLAQRDPQVVCDLLDANKADLKRHQIKIKSLEAQIEREAKAYEEKCYTLRNKMKTLRIENQKLLLRNREDFGTKKASDDTIKSKWWQLSYKIKNIVSYHFTEWPQDDTISIKRIEYDRHAQSISAGQLFAVRDSIKRRHLWHSLFCQIFDGLNYSYFGDISRPIACLIADLDPYNLPSPQYLQMISRIKSFLDLDVEQERCTWRIDTLERIIRDTVAQFKDLVADKNVYEFEGDLSRVFSDAWKLYNVMMTSNAIFIMQWFDKGDDDDEYLYDPETMELVNAHDTSEAPKYVTMVESPVLWKIGNGDGEGFDSATVLCKHCVFQWEDTNEPSTPA